MTKVIQDTPEQSNETRIFNRFSKKLLFIGRKTDATFYLSKIHVFFYIEQFRRFALSLMPDCLKFISNVYFQNLLYKLSTKYLAEDNFTFDNVFAGLLKILKS